ncbi:MAG: NUDIX domain-containing protein [Caulobacter sp.]|nr:NUDIX domain-containing protein [Caulobacter sp.]MDP1967451.1 NUDIX domain-containing protein [Reyranella sp.]
MPQFGAPPSGQTPRERPAAFGVAERDGAIALVRIRPAGGGDWLDLPGGAIDPGEDELQALIREFGEETGLEIRAGRRITDFGQYFVLSSGEAVNNVASVHAVEVTGAAPALKIEADHELVWLDPTEAIRRLRHDGHAWAVARWLRETAI